MSLPVLWTCTEYYCSTYLILVQSCSSHVSSGTVTASDKSFRPTLNNDPMQPVSRSVGTATILSCSSTVDAMFRVLMPNHSVRIKPDVSTMYQCTVRGIVLFAGTARAYNQITKCLQKRTGNTMRVKATGIIGLMGGAYPVVQSCSHLSLSYANNA